MSTPSNILSNFRPGIITGGQKGDTPPDEGLTARYIIPTEHGPSVDPTKMPFVTSFRNPTQNQLESNDPPPEPGATGIFIGDTGNPNKFLAGIVPDINNSQSVEGNSSLTPLFMNAVMKRVGKNMPTQYKEKEERGALVRDIEQEFGEWFHGLTKGLPTHAASAPMAGQFLPSVKQIPTAVQNFASILGPGTVAQLAGNSMNSRDLFNKMTEEQKKRATENMPPEIQEALNSYLNLLRSGESAGLYIGGNPAHAETFIENAVTLLSQVTTYSDLMTVLHRFHGDETIRGLDKLEQLTVTANSAFGQIEMTVDPVTGATKNSKKSDDAVQKAISTLMGLMNSSKGGGLKPLFGDAQKLVAEAHQRIENGQQMVSEMSKVLSGTLDFDVPSQQASYYEGSVENVIKNMGG